MVAAEGGGRRRKGKDLEDGRGPELESKESKELFQASPSPG